MIRVGLLLLALIAPTAAADTFVTVPLASYHLDRHRGYNEINLGIGIEHELNDRWRLGAGTYRNSIRRDSYYAGAVYAPLSVVGVKLGASLGVVTGYGRPLPMLAPTLMFEGSEYGVNLLLVPPVGGKGGVIGVQVKWRLR